MNRIHHSCIRPLMRCLTNILHPALLRWTGIVALLAAALTAPAASFFADFNSGLPDGTAVYGNAAIIATGGYTNSGYLQLTPAALSQTGGFVITNDLDAGIGVYGFVAQFKVFIGGGNGADGIGFNFASDLPLGPSTADGGAGTGLSIEFDTYSNGTTDDVGIDVHVGGGIIATQPFGGLRANTWVDVIVQLHPDGTLDVYYDNFHAYSNLPTGLGLPITGGHFGFGASTGSLDDNQWIDNLSITTVTNQGPFVDYYYPFGSTVRPDAPINILLTDYVTALDTNTIVLKLDGSPVVPTVLTQAPPQTVIWYTPPSAYASGSSHTVSLTFADNSTPPITNTLQWGFNVATFPTLPTNLVANPSFANLSSPGFSIRYSQIADLGSRDVSRAELQLANLLIDGSTGLPYDNLAAPNPMDSTFTFLETNVINYGFPAGSTGDFPNDTTVPGMPGPTTGNGSSYAMDAVTYLHLSPGFYTLGVNSSDGFKLMVADGADIFAPQEAIFSGVRSAADTTVSFSVALGGYYPFRLVYFTGDPTYGPAPGTATPSVEFFSLDSSGNRMLVNDTNITSYVPAFTAAKTKPYIRSVSPNIGDSGVAGNAAITATLVDQSLTVLTNTILLQVNGTTVPPNISSNAGVSTVSFQPTAVFAPNSSNYVSLAFTDSGSNRRTNTWSFTVANIMSPIWSIAAVNNTWVTAGSTERGLAYNPKTGHLLLVSRAAAPAPANGLGVAILDSANGNVLGTLNLGSGVVAGGTFVLSLVDVADDGVIYVCNLTTSAAANFNVYRWQDETSTPTIAFSGVPVAAAGTPRWGDDFRVRGSGSGTQLIASGNNASANSVPVFTTLDGTNFNVTLLVPTGLGNSLVRLGLAWGCGNTFYGETTGQPVSYVGFNGVPASTAGSLIASYGIYDKNTNQSIGPIGLDIANQRLIGNQTVAPHNINLYDLPSLVATPTKNFPIDQRNYSSQNTSFGTGAIDFSPDGSRVFCLDTGNGIIAFSLTPRVAALSICAQPQTNIVAGIGSVGFMDVTAIGAPQKYQWRFNATSPVAPGTPILNATNRTLDIYNVQQGQLGYYSVVISNATLLTSVTSAVAVLDTQMVVTNQPVSQHVVPGGTATFTVGVTNGLPAYTYQWLLFGTNTVGTSQTLTIPNAEVANAGLYSVVITDALGQTVASASATLYVGVAGTGVGLLGEYYNLPVFSGPPVAPFSSGTFAGSQIDPTININWGAANIGPAQADYVTVRWSGQVQPLYSQTYTFYTTSDDGSALWVNGQHVVNNWFTQGPTERSGTIALVGGQKYDIVMEYYEQTGGAEALLNWSSANQPKEIIPQTQLYPAASAPVHPVLRSTQVDATHLTLQWDGSYALLSAPSVTGPWTLVSGATSPYAITVNPAQPALFFGLLNQ